ncbi:hypothetical protein L0F63_001377 [Massospora cicadina]|nr:hypothetical protein L0F63_001377 [Massospora cicadina]
MTTKSKVLFATINLARLHFNGKLVGCRLPQQLLRLHSGLSQSQAAPNDLVNDATEPRATRGIPEHRVGADGFTPNEHDEALFKDHGDSFARRRAFLGLESGDKNKFSIYTFNYMLNIFAKKPTLYRNDAEALFKDVVAGKFAAKPSAQTYAMMLLLYSKLGDYPAAEQVYAQMLTDRAIKLEPMCFDALNLCYLNGRASQEKMEKVVQEMQQRSVEPTVNTYAILIEGCLHTKDETRVQSYLGKLGELGVKPNLRICNALLCLANQVERSHTEVLELYQKFLRDGITPDAFTLAALIQGCVRCQAREVALGVLDDMLKLGVIPSFHTFKLLGLTSMEAFNRVVGLGIEVPTKLYNLLLTYACKNNEFNTAFKITTHMHRHGREPDLFSYGILMEAYVKMGNGERAFLLFEEMKRKGFQPDAHIYRSLIESMRTSADLDRALNLIQEAEKDGADNLYVYNTMLGLCARTKTIHHARKIFQRMKHRGIYPSTRSYNLMLSIMTSYSKSGEAWETYAMMGGSGATPDRTTYDIMLRLCTDQMDHVRALSLFEDMKRSEACFPTSVDCSTIMRLLAVLNKGPMAFDLWMGFVVDPRAKVQDASLFLFLNLCQSAKRPKLAISSFEVLKSRVLSKQIQPLNLHPATYLLYLHVLAASQHFATLKTAFDDAKPIFGAQLHRGHLETLRDFFTDPPELREAFQPMLDSLPEGEFDKGTLPLYLQNPFPGGAKGSRFKADLVMA